ncbi:hypothetical protein Rsub_00643 [Raphidocelis subcapitata]|uniref:Uncharacterized protein n=1 Tax=Raphidocelis subcapitata TaxID=307507 RepID=A0A2V0NKR0_9CHLO|nr:hypothetical protein Rsub_00643 [Raphidocelis subcapitata]|eukprot:GBF87931.1 hypothetical protein Rsub_00643 [Raphidocelis subcapitata]
MSKQRNIRKKRTLEEEEEGAGAAGAAEEVEKAALEDLKLLQRQRKRAAGIHSSALAASRAGEDDQDEADNELMEAYVKAQGGASAVLTEEQHMERFVEQEVAKRLGKQVDELARAPSAAEREEQALYEVPAELKAVLKQEVSIPGLNTAITEVEVSREARLRRIEETEAVKRRLLDRDAWEAEPNPADAAPARTARAAFVPRFGRQQPKKDTITELDPEEARRRLYISERTDPSKLKGLKGGLGR